MTRLIDLFGGCRHRGGTYPTPSQGCRRHAGEYRGSLADPLGRIMGGSGLPADAVAK